MEAQVSHTGELSAWTGRAAVHEIEFTGAFGAFARIALVNLLLTIVSLGFYRFWATTRVRRYLWANTRFFGEPFEWTGTGLELFKGFLAVLVIILLPIAALSFYSQFAMMAGDFATYGVITAVIYVIVLYFIGVALFRALRYRLSRTVWRGIRGGSADPGWGYGALYLAMMGLNVATLGLAVPFTSVKLWNLRWSRMEYGDYPIGATAISGGLYKSFFLAILLTVAALLIVLVGGALAVSGIVLTLGLEQNPMASAVGVVVFVFLFYGVFGIVGVWYYARYMQTVVGGMTLANLDASFSADAGDWLKLLLGNLGLILITLGVGLVLIPYRNWRFFCRHLTLSGEIDFDRLRQTDTPAMRQGEGLAGAFDVGAI
jgi:uncharacterized membrane protein YjgN (DUF898 family)